MTVDVAVVVSIGAGLVGIAGGAVAWVAKTTVLGRLDSLESSRDGMGGRFGEGQKKTEIWQACHDAVELDRQGRWPR